MYLQGQGNQRGYAMAALLVSVGVMMLLMSAALPVWRHQAQREKEAELVFRANQYARAINLYTRKAGPGNFPPSIDILVQQRFLRKKYKDPMIKDGEFEIITAAGAQQGQQPGSGRGNVPSSGVGPQEAIGSVAVRGGLGVGGGSRFGGQNSGSAFGGQNSGPFAGGQQGPGGGIIGVRSKSKETSIRVFNGGTHYNEWSFLFSNVSNRPVMPGTQGQPGMPGGGRGGSGRPGMPGGIGGGPGGMGGPGRSNMPGPFQPSGRGRGE